MANQKFNYIDSITPLVPSMYIDRESVSYGSTEELSYKTLSYFLKLVGDASSLFESSSINSVAQLQSKFVPGNKLTRVTPEIVNNYLLAPLGKQWEDFSASSEFVTFMEASGLSSITLSPSYSTNQMFALWFSGNEGAIPGVSSLYPEVSTVGLAQDKLLEKFGLLHILNSSGATIVSKHAQHTELSSLASSLWTENLYGGSSVDEEACLHVLSEYIWKNREYAYVNLDAEKFIPHEFLSSTAQVSGETYLSGTQLLDAYKTSLSLWLNKDMDSSPMVQNSLDVYLSSTLIPTKFANSGSLSKFLRALGYASYDIHHAVDSLSDLIDINNCPPEFLDYLATLIGWKLIGTNATEWRQQLRNAVTAYKMKGTASGLDAVVEHIFDRDVFFPTSGLTETWESYFPNLLYYVLKTESFMASATAADIGEWGKFWRRTENIKVNYDSESEDNNIRFAVDVLLQHLDNVHKLIHIKGEHWKDSDMWKGILNNPNSANGFNHRGKIVDIPPWENDRFYSDSYVTLEALGTLSSVLVRASDQGGLGVTHEASQYITDFCKANLGLDQLPPLPGDRPRFKFLTSSLAVAPNTSSLPLQSDRFEDTTNLSDYWNRKSSVMVLDINALDADFRQKGNSKLNLKNLRMLHQVFRDFVPLRVMINTVITNNLADGGGSQQQNDGIFDGYGWGTGGLLPSGIFCIQGDYSKQDSALDVVNQTFASGFQGAQSGDASAGSFQEGRYVPDVNTTYWETVGAVPARNVARARNLRYNLPGRFFSRNGRNTPHTMDFMNTYFWGDTPATMASAGHFIDTLSKEGFGFAFSALEASSYQPKGWNFSSQSYLDVSSREFDTSNSIRANRDGHARPKWQSSETGLSANSCFPFRSPEKYSVDCSAMGAEERHRVFEITRTIIDVILKNNEVYEDRALLNFNHEDLLNKEFGTGIHQLFRTCTDVFFNRIENDPFSIINHIFGPFVIGHDIPLRGKVLNGDLDNTQAHTPGKAPGVDDTIITRHEYKAVLGGEGIHGNLLYNSSGHVKLIENYGLASEGGLHAYKPDIDSMFGIKQYSNISLLSAVEVVASPTSKSFAVLNDVYSPLRVTDENIDMMSLFGRGAHRKYEDCLKFRYPLLQNKNFLTNPDFKPNPTLRTDLPLYSLDIKGWDLADLARDPVWNNTGSNTGTLTYEDGSNGPFSNYNTLNDLAGNNNYIVIVSKLSNTIAGNPFKNKAAPTIRTSTNTFSDTSSTDLKSLRTGLVPGKTYKLSLDTVSQVDTGAWTYVLANVTKNEYYSTWGWGASSINAVNVTLPATSTATREILEDTILIPDNFEPGDDYQLFLSYGTGTGTTAGKWSALFNASLKEVISSESNCLLTDSKYRFTIEAQAGGVKFENLEIPRKFGVLGARVTTDVVPDAFGRNRRYVYNFIDKTWIDLNVNHYVRDLTSGVEFLKAENSLFTSGGEFKRKGSGSPFIGMYHTMNNNGIVSYMEGAFHNYGAQGVLIPVSDNHCQKDLMEDGVLFSIPASTEHTQKLEFDIHTIGQPHIHTSSTGYYVEFFRVQGPNPERPAAETRVDIHTIAGYSLGLRELTTKLFNVADYDKDDTASILRYFQSIVTTYKLNSRNPDDSAQLAGPNGGGRSEMITPYGGGYRTNADDGEATFGTGNESTTLYEI